MMMNKSILSLALAGFMSQTVLGQNELNLVGSFSMDRFDESHPGELAELAASKIQEYQQYVVEEATEEATIGKKVVEDPCSIPGSITVAEYCMSLTNDNEPLYVWCKSLMDTNLIFRYANRADFFTIFAPTRQGFIKYYTEVARVPEVPYEKLVPILEYHDIKGTIYEPNKLWCKKKYSTTTTLLAGNIKPPKILCQSDIAGEPVTFLRGSDKTSQKVFPPQFEHPGNPVRVCNANIYEMSNLVLPKDKVSNNKKNKNKNKNNAPVAANLVIAPTEAPIPAPTPAPTKVPTAPVPSPITMLYGN
eukprot:CAMPEP_0172385668 /NCGR_PEP_ID=MMETSP1061-20121228/3279_1 /TAXON_ID=37318 /ORGANISM="Pseudo-nitzschia pungens, Strain cf. pungens" /LENGTH=303 /DNA_ID=CAMNT_0013114759 /DNA_START=170 /DNA_END=1081 /DNA_ORIENTATION=-